MVGERLYSNNYAKMIIHKHKPKKTKYFVSFYKTKKDEKDVQVEISCELQIGDIVHIYDEKLDIEQEMIIKDRWFDVLSDRFIFGADNELKS